MKVFFFDKFIDKISYKIKTSALFETKECDCAKKNVNPTPKTLSIF